MVFYLKIKPFHLRFLCNSAAVQERKLAAFVSFLIRKRYFRNNRLVKV